jgi:phosphoglycolate phosphatase
MKIHRKKKSMTFEAIIFDLDGTLLDTLEDIAISANNVLEKHEFPTYKVNDYRDLIGGGVRNLVTQVLPEDRRTDKMITEFADNFRDEYGKNWNLNTKPYEGIPELLDELITRHYKLAVHSNKPDAFTQKYVRELLSHWSFEMVLGQRSEIPRKPDPAGAQQIARFMDVPPAHMLYIGDTATDMQTAIAAGMFPVGVAWGFRPKEELQNNGARAMVEHPREILALLENTRHES